MDNLDEIDGIEVTMNDFQERLIQRHTNLNQSEIDYANAHLDEIQIAEKGYIYCNHCGHNQRHFELIWENTQNIREMKGFQRQKRKKPYFVVNEKHNRGLHLYKKLPDGKTLMIPFGNIDRACVSCNAKIHRHNEFQPNDIEIPYTSRVSIEKRDRYKELLDNALVTAIHLCAEGTFNKYSGRSMLHCSQKMLREAFYQEFDVEGGFDLIELKDYPNIHCNYRLCTGEHIIKRGNPPERTMTDLEVQREELEFGIDW